ncbi:hypothetical protein N172_02195 [Pantoea dispersa EGD-AAK13]|nr:hypothetical protein N172_02195 [Pantoea dispersa EGD-AAK13]KAF0854779.1 hypothetical protein Y788_16205 [Pantoea dispersa 625]
MVLFLVHSLIYAGLTMRATDPIIACLTPLPICHLFNR